MYLKLSFAVLGLLACTSALYETGDVIELTPQNFDSLVLQSNSVWVVQFYAPWCRYSKNLEADYKRWATISKDTIKLGAVNVQMYQSLGVTYNITGYPTIKIFGADKSKPIPAYQYEHETMVDVVRDALAVKLESNKLQAK